MRTAIVALVLALAASLALAPEPAAAAPLNTLPGTIGKSIILKAPGTAPGAVIPAARRVCVFDKLFFAGAEHCWPANTTLPVLPARWNNEIASLRLFAGAHVQLCTGADFTGDCKTFAADAEGVGIVLMERASSLKVW